MELEQETVCQKNLQYIKELRAKDEEERETQVKMDQETAHALQKEEMEHLGDFSFSFCTSFCCIYDYCKIKQWMCSEFIIKTCSKLTKQAQD